jgi:hypothetical protein
MPWFSNTYLHKKKNQEDSSQVTVQTRKLEFASATNPAPRIIFGQPLAHFTTVIVVVKHRRNETTCEDAY